MNANLTMVEKPKTREELRALIRNSVPNGHYFVAVRFLRNGGLEFSTEPGAPSPTALSEDEWVSTTAHVIGI